MLRYIIITIMLLLPVTTQAALYKYVNNNGRITYTDTPPSLEAQAHELGSINEVGNPTYNMEKLSMIIPFTQENGAMIVSGTVNGVHMRFVVDTGATFVAIPPTIAQSARISQENAKMITAQTANGRVQVPHVTIDTLQVSRVTQNGVNATIQKVSDTDNKMGLLGMSFFEKYKMTINHEKSEIELEQK